MATLTRVLVENYKVFCTKQEVDFRQELTSSTDNKYFTLVGENGSGKSTFLALIGLASNFGGKVTSHVCDKTKASMVACEYKVKNWAEIMSTSKVPGQSYPALQLWFMGGLLKIPPDLHGFLTEKYVGLNVKDVLVVIGFRRSAYSASNFEENVHRFLYIQSKNRVVALIHGLDSEAKILVNEPSDVVNLLHWCPDESKLISTGCHFLPDLKESNNSPIEYLNLKHPQTSLILSLRNALPLEARSTIWADIMVLFHELTGDTKITVVHDAQSNLIHVRQQYGDCDTIRDDLPEGFFHAFLVAFLILNPANSTVLLDEPTRGMHPLQIRRLRRILSQKSLHEDKVIIVASHAPDMVHTSEIDHIFRFQQLRSGFVEIRRTSSYHDNRDLRFVSSVESRELFFTRSVIWVEGDTDQRFCETMLKFIDEGNPVLWSTLLDPNDCFYECRIINDTNSAGVPMDDEIEDSTDEIDYGAMGIDPLENLFQSRAYGRKYYTKEELMRCQELARSCSILPLSGKKNMDKATKICKDLRIPFAVICDLDAVLPNSRKNSIMSQFLGSVGNWSLARADKKLLFDGEQSPAFTCLEDTSAQEELRKCRNALDVMEFYEKNERIFAWRVGNGEIEDVVKVTKPKFSKKRWADFTAENFQDLMQMMLSPASSGYQGSISYTTQRNLELLRCFRFIIEFLNEKH